MWISPAVYLDCGFPSSCRCRRFFLALPLSHSFRHRPSLTTALSVAYTSFDICVDYVVRIEHLPAGFASEKHQDSFMNFEGVETKVQSWTRSYAVGHSRDYGEDRRCRVARLRSRTRGLLAISLRAMLQPVCTRTVELFEQAALTAGASLSWRCADLQREQQQLWGTIEERLGAKSPSARPLHE